MASELEKIPDRAMFQILKQVARNCESEGISFGGINSEVSDVIKDTLKIFGVVDKIRYIDEDYIWTLVNLNKDKLSDDKITGSLIRPELKKYEFNSEVSETIYQTQTWRDTVESYGDPYSLVRVMEENSDWDYYNGREIFTDIYDSETNEIRINRKSFNEI
jgi:N-acetylneuraminic acid mutarotase